MTTSFGCLCYVRASRARAQVASLPVALPGGPPRGPAALMTGELLPLDGLEQPPSLVGAQLLDRFSLGRSVSAARHRTDRGVGIALVARHVVVTPAVVRVPAPARGAAAGAVVTQPAQRHLE